MPLPIMNYMKDFHNISKILPLIDGLLFFNFVNVIYLLVFYTVNDGSMLAKLALTSVSMCSLFVIPTSFAVLVFRKYKHRRV